MKFTSICVRNVNFKITNTLRIRETKLEGNVLYILYTTGIELWFSPDPIPKGYQVTQEVFDYLLELVNG